jgi:hypothetical protein
MADGGDADWEMFCRGRGDETDHSCPVSTDEPVALEPEADEAPAEAPPSAVVSQFFAPVVGLPYPNSDGTNRREAVRGLRPRDRVRLTHRPDNPVDANAVAVLRTSDGRQLGYLPAALAADVVAAARQGTRYLALVSEVAGAAASDLLGIAPVRVRLLILALDGGATISMARAFLRAGAAKPTS